MAFKIREKEVEKIPYILICFIVIMIVFLWLTISKRGENVKLVQKNKQLQQKIKKARQAKKRLEMFEQGGKIEIKQKGKIMEEKVPTNKFDILNIVSELTTLGKNLGIRQMDFTLGKLSSLSQSKTSSKMRGGMEGVDSERRVSQGVGMESTRLESYSSQFGQKQQGGLYKQPIKIEFQGTYSQVVEFIFKIRQMNRLITVERLKISRDEAAIPYSSVSLYTNIYTFLSSQQ